MEGVRGGLLFVLVIVFAVGVYFAVWLVGHFVMTIGVPCADLRDRVHLAWLWSESGRVGRSRRPLADWSARNRAKVRGGTASARYLDAMQADALIAMDECAAGIEALDRIGEDGLRLGRIMRPGHLELKWVLAAIRVGRYEQATRVMGRVVAVRDDAPAMRIGAALEFLVSGDLKRYANAERRAEAALRARDSDDRRKLRMQGAAVVMAARGDSAAFEELRARTGEFVTVGGSSEGEQLDRASSLAELGRWAALVGRRDVVDDVTRALEGAPTTHWRLVGKLAELRGLRLGLDGDLDGARRALEEARAVARMHDYPPLAAEARLTDAALATFDGDRRAAQSAVDDAVDRFRSMGSNGGVRESQAVAILLGLDPPAMV